MVLSSNKNTCPELEHLIQWSQQQYVCDNCTENRTNQRLVPKCVTENIESSIKWEKEMSFSKISPDHKFFWQNFIFFHITITIFHFLSHNYNNIFRLNQISCSFRFMRYIIRHNISWLQISWDITPKPQHLTVADFMRYYTKTTISHGCRFHEIWHQD